MPINKLIDPLYNRYWYESTIFVKSMRPGVSIRVADNDGDYLGIEIQASNGRFAGYAWIYADNEALSELATAIAGFPTIVVPGIQTGQ